MDEYRKLEKNAPPQYSYVCAPPVPYPSAAGPPVTEPPPPIHPSLITAALPEGYINHGFPGASPPVVSQPQVVYVQNPMIPKHEAPDHLVMAILVTICCCFSLGIIGILRALDSRSARMKGDRANALKYSREANKFSFIGLLFGIALIVVVIAVYSSLKAFGMTT